MHQTFIYICFLLLFHCQSNAQPTYEWVHEVYGHLQTAIGDLDADYPDLMVLDRDKNIAAYRKADNKLILEKRAIEICEGLKEDKQNAMAFLIGHELAHFYRNHDWDNGTYFLASTESLQEHSKDEAEADQYGVFVAYIAGYETIDIIPQLLDSLYINYSLSSDLRGYPALSARKQSAYGNCEKVAKLLEIFELGNRFSVAGYYTQANAAYSYVLSYVKNKALYNNLGINIIKEVLQNHQLDNYRYPLEYETEAPFRDASFSDPKELLNEAITNLEAAVRYDPSYHKAFVNLSIAYILKERFSDAKSILTSLESVEHSMRTEAQIKVLTGIIMGKQGYLKEAENIFKGSSTIHSDLNKICLHNQKVTKNEYPEKSVKKMNYAAVEEYSGYNGLNNTELTNSITLDATDPLYPIFLNSSEQEDRIIHTVRQGNNTASIIWTKSEHVKTKRDLGTGSSLEEISRAYSNDSERYTTSSDSYVWIAANGLLFKLDHRDRVKEWGTILNY